MPMPAPYKSQHTEEDFSALKDPAKRTDLFDPLKYIPLLGKDDWVLSLGGEARERYEYFNNRNFGAGTQDRNGYLLQRYMFFGDVHLGHQTRIFSEFKSGQIHFTPRALPDPRTTFSLTSTRRFWISPLIPGPISQ
jgi:hypothetical protein